MEKFELHILGCGSALPTTRHFATSQVVNLREKLFMIDCGEGAQMQLRRSRLKFSRLNHIFISHLHGDHCFGLLGLISTFGLLGRTADLHIHSPKGLEELFAPMLAFFFKTQTFKVFFHEFETKEPTQIYDDRSVTVTTIPLKHRIPCCGFLFEEKQRPNHIIREMVDFYKVPVYELNRIKNGVDFVGYRHWNSTKKIRKDAMRRLKRLMKNFKDGTITEEFFDKSLTSRIGSIKHADTYNLVEKITCEAKELKESHA